MRIACPECQLELQVKRNSVGVESMDDRGSYQYFSADLWQCPSCGFEILAGFGTKPIVEHYDKPRYERFVATDRAHNVPVFKVWANQEEKTRFESRSGDAA